MGNPHPNMSGLKNWQPGQSGNAGRKTTGRKHISTLIQKLMMDPEFTATIKSKGGTRLEFKGMPAEAIIKTAMIKAMSGDVKWAEWIAKHGWGTKTIHEMEVNPIERILAGYGLSAEEIAAETMAEENDSVSVERVEHSEPTAEEVHELEEMTIEEVIDVEPVETEKQEEKQTQTTKAGENARQTTET